MNGEIDEDVEERIDAEVRKARKESEAYLVKKHLARWTEIGQRPFHPMNNETVLVKLSQNTSAVPVQVPRIPKDTSPSVQAMIVASHYTMQEVENESIRRDHQAINERGRLMSPYSRQPSAVRHAPSDDEILIEGRPKLTVHGHPSPAFHPEQLKPVRPVQSLQPLPQLLIPAGTYNPQDHAYHFNAAARDRAFHTKQQRGRDIDLKMAHLKSIQQFNTQYVSFTPSLVLNAARGMAYARAAGISCDIPRALRPPQRPNKPAKLHDQFISEMRVAAERMHYRRRVRWEYRCYTAQVCESTVSSDIETRGRFVADDCNIGVFKMNFPVDDEPPVAQSKNFKLGYRRESLYEQAACFPGARSDTTTDWRTAEDWWQIVQSRGASLSQSERQRLGLDRFGDKEVKDSVVRRVMSVSNAWDVDRDIDKASSDYRGYHFVEGADTFCGYIL